MCLVRFAREDLRKSLDQQEGTRTHSHTHACIHARTGLFFHTFLSSDRVCACVGFFFDTWLRPIGLLAAFLNYLRTTSAHGPTPESINPHAWHTREFNSPSLATRVCKYVRATAHFNTAGTLSGLILWIFIVKFPSHLPVLVSETWHTDVDSMSCICKFTIM